MELDMGPSILPSSNMHTNKKTTEIEQMNALSVNVIRLEDSMVFAVISIYMANKDKDFVQIALSSFFQALMLDSMYNFHPFQGQFSFMQQITNSSIEFQFRN